MEIPADVMIHNEVVGFKGNQGRLLRIADEGYYELNVTFGQAIHRVLLPIESTVLIQAAPEPAVSAEIEIER